MNGLKLFGSFFKTSIKQILEDKKTYYKSFFALVFLGNVETLFPFLGAAPESVYYIFLSVFTTLLTFIILSQVVLVQKKLQGGVGELKYFVPTFLLYNLYYSFLFFIGLFLFIVPGFYVLIFFSMVPFIAVLDDECEGSFYEASKLLVKKNVGLVVWATLINLLIEFSALLITPIENAVVKGSLNLVYSLVDSFITLVMIISMVKIYYYLKRT